MTKSKILKEKLEYYNKPFISKEFLQKLFDKFAEGYTAAEASKRGLITPIKSGQIYYNKLYRGDVSRYSILGKYMGGKEYMIGGIYLYNKYGFSTQLANKITVYNTTYSGQKEIAGAKFIFHKVRKSFLRGKQKNQSQNISYYLMSPERALIQLLQDTKGNPEFINDICHQLYTKKVDINKLKKLTKKHCSQRLQNLISNFLTACSNQ